MRKLYILFAIIIVASSIQALEVTSTSGNLSKLLQKNKDVITLTVKGTMDVRDFKFISDSLPALSQIDLSGVNISEYNNNIAFFGSKVNYKANVLPHLCMFGKPYKSIKLPSTITAIDDGALSGCTGITELILPNKLTTIGSYALYDCDALGSINIPASVTLIGDYAFAKCNKLSTILNTTSTNTVAIGKYSFNNCPLLKTVTLSPNTTTIGSGAFASCSQLTTLSFPSALISIGEEAFKATPLTKVDLSGCTSLSTIGQWAFADNKAMQSINLPISIESIGNGAFFYNSSLKQIVLPPSITKISDFMLTGCVNIEADKVLNSEITEIGKYAFTDWNLMVKFYIPKNVTYIGDNAFENCKNITMFIAEPIEVPALGENVFKGIDQPNTKLCVPVNSLNAYKGATQWNGFNITTDPATSINNDSKKYLKAFFTNRILNIEASSTIKEVRMHDFSGIELIRINPNNNSTTIDTKTYSGQNYIVSVLLEDNTIKQFKLARK